MVKGVVVEAAHCSTPDLNGRFARLAKRRRKLGQVCDPRWTILRPNDQLLSCAVAVAAKGPM